MEERFDLNVFLDNLEDILRDEVDYKGDRDDILDRMEEVITDEIDRACIYTDDCWDIAKDLVGTEAFSKYDMSDNITELAYSALQAEVISQIDLDKIIDEEKKIIKEQEEEI